MRIKRLIPKSLQSRIGLYFAFSGLLLGVGCASLSGSTSAKETWRTVQFEGGCQTANPSLALQRFRFEYPTRFAAVSCREAPRPQNYYTLNRLLAGETEVLAEQISIGFYTAPLFPPQRRKAQSELEELLLDEDPMIELQKQLVGSLVSQFENQLPRGSSIDRLSQLGPRTFGSVQANVADYMMRISAENQIGFAKGVYGLRVHMLSPPPGTRFGLLFLYLIQTEPTAPAVRRALNSPDIRRVMGSVRF